MKIISWNCRGAFIKKFSYIFKNNADIYVIQECENPEKYKKEFLDLLINYTCIWCGENENRGLGIFARPDIQMKNNNWPTYGMRHYLSVRINDGFDLLGVWACHPYIEEYYVYQQIHIKKYGESTILIGDFNSNAIWDKGHGIRNHSEIVRQLQAKGIVSAYHHITGEQMGEETGNTFYLHKNQEKKFHIDYCFLNPQKLQNFKILNSEECLQFSDHKPIQVVIK